MRGLPLALLVTLGCTTTTVARLSPAQYESRSSDSPVQLYSSQLPACAFDEIAILKARKESWLISTNAVVNALRIVTEGVKDCYAALGIIHKTWSPVPGQRRTRWEIGCSCSATTTSATR